ncbi:MAG: adenylate kinase [Chloroflexi bacterium]|nr:MAG: adenylate kinase [Chloroflexota bacterium]
MNILLIGAQGSGKGTQAQLLEEQLNLKSCASGELLRDAIARGTPLGNAAKPYYDNGDLVPDQLVAGLVLERLKELGDSSGIILDGFPRTIAQAELLDRMLAEIDQSLSVIFYLEVSRDVLLDRLSGRFLCRAHGHVWNIKTHRTKVPGICDFDGSELYQRSDDTGEKIARRLDIFFGESIQLVGYYEAQHKLVHIDGQKSVEEVHRQIMEILRPLTVDPPPDSRWRRLWNQISNTLAPGQ